MPRSPSIGEMLNRAARLLRRLADRRLAPLGLSSGHLPVLTALMENEFLSQKGLVEHAAIEQPTMAATLARMERDGVIARQPDPHDKRSVRFALTPETRRKVPAIKAVIEEMSLSALSGLQDTQRDTFQDMLQTTVASLKRALGE